MNGKRQAAHDTFLQFLILAYCAASLLHFVHNAVYLRDYPNMPASLSASGIYAAWCGVTAVGVVGYWLDRASYRVAGLVVIAVYAALGFGGLDHYTLAPVSAHSLAMNVTIGLEALAAAALLIAVCARMRTTHWVMTAIIGLLLTSCAGIGAGPSTETRQALAPTGKLRVGLQLGNPLNVIRDSASGEMKGVGFDLGTELARRMGVPFEPVLYPSVGVLLDSGKSGAWDVAFVGFSPARAEEWSFSALHLEVEFGYLVPGGSPISGMADVDRPGIRVAVQEKSGPDSFFSRTLKNAVVIRASSNPAALEAVKSWRADVMGSLKPILFEMSNQLPGSRVLDGRPGIDPHAMAIPKGRDLGVAYARQFIEDAKSEGLVKTAIERAGLRGVSVAPLK